jgi:outer membrane phospholipase A
MFRNNLRLDKNRSAIEPDASFPLVGYLNGYVHYFVYYGQSLIECDHFDNAIGVGVEIED